PTADPTPRSGPTTQHTIVSNHVSVTGASFSGVSSPSLHDALPTAGAGTMTNVSIGTNSGTVTASEDTTAGSGTISNSTIGTNTGTVTGGSLSGASCTSNGGSIGAAGQGTMTNGSIGTNTGPVTATD